ncbi:MAG: CPBP family intramembrane metalloprotease [Myxococcaceae bacterium]|nr:CPBP family intramembrane metalloprotease [Myxococcaceae bacterium]MBH2005836.1 CPBP family intramembrane metalloprotease [Myxococcaceae bacterium]
MRIQAAWAAFGLLLCLALLKPLSGDLAFLAAFAYQIYVPGWIRPMDSPLAFLNTVDLRSFKFVLWLAFITFSLYGGFYFLAQTGWASRAGYQTAFFPAKPNTAMLWSFCVQFLFVALAEEYFYRGFLQKIWGGLSGVLCVNAAFALGHFIGEYDPVRLLPFFPGLLFSWIYHRSGSLFAVTLFHALCNSYSEWLAASFHWSPK